LINNHKLLLNQQNQNVSGYFGKGEEIGGKVGTNAGKTGTRKTVGVDVGLDL
jgi:hypothetical protein